MRHTDALEVTTTVSLPMSETSQPGEARRAAMRLASRAGLDDEAAGKVGIAVTEAASNVVKHGRGGDVILRMLRDGEGDGVEMLALDRGAGMANIGECLRDGYSTSGTPGTGLGAIRRLSSEFDVHSIPGVGTAVLARFWNLAPPKPGVEVGAVCVAKPGELVCGDAWAVARRAGVTVILIVDGLGHGVPASDAAAAALGAFAASRIAEPRVVIEEIHAALRPTRGAAVAVAALDPDVALVDIELGDEDGIALTRQLAETAPSLKVVLISAYDPADVDELVVDSRALGFVPKSSLSADAVRALL